MWCGQICLEDLRFKVCWEQTPLFSPESLHTGHGWLECNTLIAKMATPCVVKLLPIEWLGIQICFILHKWFPPTFLRWCGWCGRRWGYSMQPLTHWQVGTFCTKGAYHHTKQQSVESTHAHTQHYVLEMYVYEKIKLTSCWIIFTYCRTCVRCIIY